MNAKTRRRVINRLFELCDGKPLQYPALVMDINAEGFFHEFLEPYLLECTSGNFDAFVYAFDSQLTDVGRTLAGFLACWIETEC